MVEKLLWKKGPKKRCVLPDLMDSTEQNLADDVDVFSGRFTGSLIIDEPEFNGMMRDPSMQSLGMNFDEGASRTLRQGPGNVTFEVDKAEIVDEQRNKHVVYSLVIVTQLTQDRCPVTVDRRYSDFDKLNTLLKKKFPELMCGVSFPKKLLRGNFKSETIAQRSRSFEQYLSHLFSIDLIRVSKEFCQFFYGSDLEEGYESIHNGQYDRAIPLLQRVANIEKKLLGCGNAHVIATLCALVCSYHALDKDKQAQSVAEAALRCIGKDGQNKHLIPLLQLSIRLCWTLGKDKKDLESQLEAQRAKGFQVTGGPSLLELVVHRFQKS